MVKLGPESVRTRSYEKEKWLLKSGARLEAARTPYEGHADGKVGFMYIC